MEDHAQAETTRDEKPAFSVLRLHDPRLDSPKRADLLPSDPLYRMAAWAFHHADELSEQSRTAFMESLADVWPVKSGRRSSNERRNWEALSLSQSGRSLQEIGDQYGYPANTVSKWIRAAREELDAELEPFMRIVDGQEQFFARNQMRVEVVGWPDEAPVDPVTVPIARRWLRRSAA